MQWIVEPETRTLAVDYSAILAQGIEQWLPFAVDRENDLCYRVTFGIEPVSDWTDKIRYRVRVDSSGNKWNELGEGMRP